LEEEVALQYDAVHSTLSLVPKDVVPSVQSRTLLLALGNDIIGDDALGLVAARALRPEFESSIEIVEASIAGYDLLEILEGYQNVLLLDGVLTGEHAPGTIFELSSEDFQKTISRSPHSAGLPEILDLATRLEIDVPKSIRILVMELEEVSQVKEGLSDPVLRALPEYLDRARQILFS
jgi:hydrogenase maturation protease